MRHRWSSLAIQAALGLALVSGCGSDRGSATDVAAETVVTEATTAEATETTTGTCEPGDFGGGEASVEVTTIDVHVTDAAGADLDGVVAIVCGVDLCSAPVVVTGGHAHLSMNHALKAPVVRVGDALTYVRVGQRVASGTTALTVQTVALPATGAPLAAGTRSSSGDLQVDVASRAVIAIDTLTYDTPDAQALRAVALPASVFSDAAAQGFVARYGVAPSQTTICPPAAVTVPNDAHLPAGTAVEFVVFGDEVGQGWAPWGGWARLSDGAVSADGTVITTAPGQGFPVLGMFAIRPKP